MLKLKFLLSFFFFFFFFFCSSSVCWICLIYKLLSFIRHVERIIFLKFFRDEIGVLEQVSGTSVTALIHQQIQHHVETTCKGNFETAYLENLETVSTNVP